MAAIVVEFVLTIVRDIILPPLLMLLVLPSIPIIALFGKGNYGRKVTIYTVRTWRRLKQGSFLSVLDRLFDNEKIPPRKKENKKPAKIPA